MTTRTVASIALVLIATTALWGCGSPTAPTATGWCSTDFSATLTRDGEPAGNTTFQWIIDGRTYGPERTWSGTYFPVGMGLLASESAPGSHVAEISIVAQPVSPSTYTVSGGKVDFRGYEGGTMLSCGPVKRSITLPSQTVTLATGERLFIRFEI
jgi:hypothetical protein